MFSTVESVQYRRGIRWVPWQDILNTVGDVQCRGGYHLLIFKYRRGYHDTCGGYHEYRGGDQYRGGTQITKDLSLHGTEHPPSYSRYPPRYSKYSPRYSKYSPRYWTSATVLSTPTVLNTYYTGINYFFVWAEWSRIIRDSMGSNGRFRYRKSSSDLEIYGMIYCVPKNFKANNIAIWGHLDLKSHMTLA